MKLLPLLALAAFLPLATPLQAQEAAPRRTEAPTPTGEAPPQAIRAFFAALAKNEVEAAYKGLLTGTKIGESTQDVSMLKGKTEEAIRAFGPISGAEWVETKRVGTRLSRYVFLSFGADYPMRWRFYFYETQGQSRLIDIRISDRLSEMFDEPLSALPSPAR